MSNLPMDSIDLIVFYRYVFGVTHVPRLEDWPVMPVERIGFMLMVFYCHLLDVYCCEYGNLFFMMGCILNKFGIYGWSC